MEKNETKRMENGAIVELFGKKMKVVYDMDMVEHCNDCCLFNFCLSHNLDVLGICKATNDTYFHFSFEIEKAEHTEEELIDYLTNLSCEEFTKFMQEINRFGESDEVFTYSPKRIANIIHYASNNGYEIDLHILRLHDGFIYVRFTESFACCDKVCYINGVADDHECWINQFDLINVVRTHRKKIEEMMQNS